MDPLDATPSFATAHKYERLRVTHCGMITELPPRFLPDKPTRLMRFRCRRCGATLSAEEAGARWTWQGEGGPHIPGTPTPQPWSEIA